MASRFLGLVLLAASMMASAMAQQWDNGPLDPARDPARLHRSMPQHLSEQYIWTAKDAAALRVDHAKFSFRDRERKTEIHAFRGWFDLRKVPDSATLYIAGPRAVKAYLNGQLVLEATADAASPLNSHVFRMDVHSALRVGRNLIAIAAVRGRGVVAASDSSLVQQLAYGETVVAKILAAKKDVDASPIAVSDPTWRSLAATPSGWQQPEFDDQTWPNVQALGAIESSPAFFQWNTDAGMYDWPGYSGISPYLRTYILQARNVTSSTESSRSFQHPEALTHSANSTLFVVHLPTGTAALGDAPGLLLDFGREVAGRLLIQSDCDCEAQVLASYGESASEATSGGHYLGTNLIRIPPHGVARGPKSGLRYVWLRFIAGATKTAFRRIDLEGIAYPVQYKGSFASSDPLLNRIWETAAYTAHLGMQDGVWDAPKRDRGWWVGDLDVSGPVIGDVFGDSFLLDETLTRLIPVDGQHVNGIPGYSALWITTLADLYRHSGDRAFLQSKHAALLQLLKTMDEEFDASGHFLNRKHRWLFVDWSPDLFAYSEEAKEGTELEFIRAYREASWLLGELGDGEAATYRARAELLSSQAATQFVNQNGTFGERWQLNAMAVLAGVASEADYPTIWSKALNSTVEITPQTQTISPYFNDYVLQALARMGHRREALDWMRRYWGGMLDEGATSFWEAYDLRWSKEDPHRSLQADGVTGYFVSLAHGWSGGPASWLMEEMLGIRSIDAGFHKAMIRPDLMGLEWIKGQVPTPHGPIRIAMRHAPAMVIDLTLPPGVEATVLVPIEDGQSSVQVNGAKAATTSAESGLRASLLLHQAGHFIITNR